MSFKLKINTADNSFFGYSASAFFHIAILAVVFILLNISEDRSRINPRYVQVTTQDLNHNSNNLDNKPVQPQKVIPLKEEKTKKDDRPDNDKKSSPAKETSESKFYSLENTDADTTGLDQVYNEPTLNVTIKYPAGWTYIDQDVNKKLDGVTFWPAVGNYTPPPYINLDVKDKDLFDASRYKYNIKTWGYTIYYNDPEDMENQVTQIFYIRTNSGEDFSLKLIMKGEDEFKSFQLVFFGMLKSFKFGRRLF
jgi:hypothetical protein